MQLTSNGPDSSTSTHVIDNNGVTLNHAVDVGITAIPSVCDFSVFQNFDGHLHCIDS
jgi:hypothetical protein